LRARGNGPATKLKKKKSQGIRKNHLRHLEKLKWLEKTNLGFNCRPIFPSEIHCTCKLYFGNLKCLLYRPFHNTLPRSSVFVNRISVRIYEMDCMRISLRTNSFLMLYYVYIHIVFLIFKGIKYIKLRIRQKRVLRKGFFYIRKSFIFLFISLQ